MAAAPLDAQSLAVACALPTLLGLWKREYTVSYGYGGAMLWAGALALARAAADQSPLALAHAGLYIAYGLRLVLFLLYRELRIAYFRELRERVESRAPKGSRLRRLPFCLSVAALYFGMAAPLRLTQALGGTPASPFVASAIGALIGAGYVGWAVATLGDLQKTLAKARGAGLVTSGLYAKLRHPNYTGEAGLWMASAGAGVVAALGAGACSTAIAAWTALALVGCAGIQFVLAQATGSLERRHRDKYGLLPEYEGWQRRTWAGPMLPSKRS